MIDIVSHLAHLHQRIDAHCRKAGRDPADVRLLAVSKMQPVTLVEKALAAGQKDFGENRLQEALARVSAVPQARWHFIGAIQSNKTRDIAASFDWVHSLASGKAARRLAEQRDPMRGPMQTLIQVNTSGEAQKNGVMPEEVAALAEEVARLPNLDLVGLMTLPAISKDPQEQCLPFRLLREIRDQVRSQLCMESLTHLSMGMTGDFEAAIAEGATWIRIGTAIFGTRDKGL